MGGDPRSPRLTIIAASSRLILASASPRRHELLRHAGFDFEVVPADVDESVLADEAPVTYVDRVARAKATAVADSISPGSIVLAADTTVDLDGTILAKPTDDADARWMLRSLSGRTHQVHTAVVVVGERTAGVVVTTDVAFVDLADADLDWYLSVGEHLDKAGAYGIQGAAGRFVRSVSGSPSNVVGLPLAETVELLHSVTCTSDPPG